MSLVFLATCNAVAGIAPGKDYAPLKAFFADDGALVTVGELDYVTGCPTRRAEIFPAGDAAGYLKRAMELLNPACKVNIPDLAAITRALYRDKVDVCEYCRTYNCRDCIVDQWKEAEEDDS